MAIHLWQNEMQTGPYSDEEVIRHLRDGTISSADLVWEEGMDGWKPLNQVGRFLQFSPPAIPPPLPVRLSEMSAPLKPSSPAPTLHQNNDPASTAKLLSSSTKTLNITSIRPFWKHPAFVVATVGALACIFLLVASLLLGFLANYTVKNTGLNRSTAALNANVDVLMRGEVSAFARDDGHVIPIAHTQIKLFKADKLERYLEAKLLEFTQRNTPQAKILNLAFEGAISGTSMANRFVDSVAKEKKKEFTDGSEQNKVMQSLAGSLTDTLSRIIKSGYNGEISQVTEKLWFDFVFADLPSPDLIATTDFNGQTIFKVKAEEPMVAVIDRAIIPDNQGARTLRWFVQFEVDPQETLILNESNETQRSGDSTLVYQSYQKANLSIGDGGNLVANEGFELLDNVLKAQNLNDKDLAINKCSVALQQTPSKLDLAFIYNQRGSLYRQKGDFENALSDSNEALRLFPKYGNAYWQRGIIYEINKQWDKALSDLNEAIRYNPKSGIAYSLRALAFEGKLQHNLAFEDIKMAAQLAPDNADILSNIAFFLVTCPEAKFRNGKSAIAFAKKACELTHWKNYTPVDNLAAAYAEAGLFMEAIKYEKLALTIPAVKDVERKEMERCLDLYQRGLPYSSNPNQ